MGRRELLDGTLPTTSLNLCHFPQHHRCYELEGLSHSRSPLAGTKAHLAAQHLRAPSRQQNLGQVLGAVGWALPKVALGSALFLGTLSVTPNPCTHDVPWSLAPIHEEATSDRPLLSLEKAAPWLGKLRQGVENVPRFCDKMQSSTRRSVGTALSPPTLTKMLTG